MAKLSDIGKKEKEHEQFNLERALLTLPKPTRGEAVVPPAPNVGAGESLPTHDLIRQDEFPVPPPPDKSLEMARGIDFESMPPGPASEASGVFRVPGTGEPEPGKSGTLRKIGKGLSMIFPLIVAAGKGAYASDNQRYPSAIGGVGAAAKDIENDEFTRQQMEMDQRRYEDERRDKEIQLEQDLQDRELSRLEKEEKIRKAGAEADMAGMDAERYGGTLDRQEQAEEEAILNAAAKRALDKARTSSILKRLPAELEADRARSEKIRAEAAMAKELVDAGYPRARAQLLSAQAVQQELQNEYFTKHHEQEMSVARQRASALAGQAEAALLNAQQPRGGINQTTVLNTLSKVEGDIADVLSKMAISTRGMPAEQAEALKKEALEPLLQLREKANQLLQSAGQPATYPPPQGVIPPTQGAMPPTSTAPTLGSPDAADLIIQKALERSGRR